MTDLPPDPGPKFSDGAWAVLAALASGASPEELREAQRIQAEDFKRQFGCYLHEMISVCPECPDEEQHPDFCQLWLAELKDLNSLDDTVWLAARKRLEVAHGKMKESE